MTDCKQYVRIRCAYLWLATVVIGLASRMLPSMLPASVAKYPGDILYAMMIFWTLYIVKPPLSRPAAISVAVAVCFCIEFAKLYHTPTLDHFRHTLLGRLTIGVGFDPKNLLCYILGTALASFLKARLIDNRIG